MDIKQFFIDNNLIETGHNSGIYSITIKERIYKVFFIQKEWSVKNWLTIELIQGKNKFIKYNNFINSKEDIQYLFNLILK